MPVASLRAAAAALTFLTRVPVGRRLALGAGDVGRGVAFFPLVGAGIGLLAGLAVTGLEGPLPPLAAGALGVGLAVALTGALHIDALADSADALGARDREQALAIMRDPRTGSFGTVAVALAVLVEAAVLGELAARGDAVSGFAAAGALSRASGPSLALLLPYARPGGGVGGVLSGRASALGVSAGVVLALACAVLLLGTDGLELAGGVAATTVALGLCFRAWLGGVTGDTLGAATQLAEIVALVLLAALR
jgi:cobalamin 5'-phosphate synthase/cobalamin synthase